MTLQKVYFRDIYTEDGVISLEMKIYDFSADNRLFPICKSFEQISQTTEYVGIYKTLKSGVNGKHQI